MFHYQTWPIFDLYSHSIAKKIANNPEQQQRYNNMKYVLFYLLYPAKSIVWGIHLYV